MVRCLYCGKVATQLIHDHEIETYYSGLRGVMNGVLVNNVYYNFVLCKNCRPNYHGNSRDVRIDWILDRLDWITDHNLHDDYLEGDYSFLTNNQSK